MWIQCNRECNHDRSKWRGAAACLHWAALRAQVQDGSSGSIPVRELSPLANKKSLGKVRKRERESFGKINKWCVDLVCGLCVCVCVLYLCISTIIRLSALMSLCIQVKSSAPLLQKCFLYMLANNNQCDHEIVKQAWLNVRTVLCCTCPIVQDYWGHLEYS